jgi:large subunit ribosomal protein L10
MNREQKSAAIAEIADQIQESGAVFAVDFRGISVPQAADVRTRLRDADASFRVVKNTLTERAADRVGAEGLKPLLEGPTALTFVRGDVATAAKAIATFSRETQLLTFKGGIMDGDVLDGEQILAISRLPSREVLYGQLVGVVASPITGVVRTLNALIAGVAIALDQVREKKESGEIPAGDAPAAPRPPPPTPRRRRPARASAARRPRPLTRTPSPRRSPRPRSSPPRARPTPALPTRQPISRRTLRRRPETPKRTQEEP